MFYYIYIYIYIINIHIYDLPQSLRLIDLCLDLNTGLSKVTWKTINYLCSRSPFYLMYSK